MVYRAFISLRAYRRVKAITHLHVAYPYQAGAHMRWAHGGVPAYGHSHPHRCLGGHARRRARGQPASDRDHIQSQSPNQNPSLIHPSSRRSGEACGRCSRLDKVVSVGSSGQVKQQEREDRQKMYALIVSHTHSLTSSSLRLHCRRRLHPIPHEAADACQPSPGCCLFPAVAAPAPQAQVSV